MHEKRKVKILGVAVACTAAALVVAIGAVEEVGGLDELPVDGAGDWTIHDVQTSEELALTEDPLPESSMHARRDMVAEWTGSALLVWGGSSGGQASSRVLDDGSLFDPESGLWTMIDDAPLGGRTRAAAAWTGEEVVIWGGTSRAFAVSGSADAAALNPETGRWRSLAPSPPGTGRVYARAAFTDGQVVFGGGIGESGRHPSTLLVYDVAADTWNEIEMPGSVVDVNASGNGIVAAMLDDGQLRLAEVDLGSGNLGRSVAFRDTMEVIGLGMAEGGEGLSLLISTEEASYLVLFERTGLIAEDVFLLPASGTHVGAPIDARTIGGSAMMVQGHAGRIVGYAGETVFTFNVESHSLQMATPEDEPGLCGDRSAASVWTGESIIYWGGDICRGSAAGEVQDTGFEIGVG